jgi:TatD DNase family protein
LNIYFDTHCHLCLDDFIQDLVTVIQRATEKGVKYILIPGVDLATSQKAISISEQYPNIYAAVGFHPNSKGMWDIKTARTIRKLAMHSKVVAIGEIGLDQFRSISSLNEQCIRLKEQLLIAEELEKPVLLHNRCATEILLKILNEISPRQGSNTQKRGIFHAFEGDEKIFQFVEQNEYLLGIGGNITYPKSTNLKKMIYRILSKVVLETDAPFLAPDPYRYKRNEPANIPMICKSISDFVNIPEETISSVSLKNTFSLLGIKFDNL